MAAKAVIKTDLQQDLRPFSSLLWQRGIAHRVHESSGKQVLSLDNDAEEEQVQHLYQAYREGTLSPGQGGQVQVRRSDIPGWQYWVVVAPVTHLLILGCVLGGLVVWSGDRKLLSLLAFQPWFDLGGGRFFQGLAESLQAGELWRLFTPMFLHFSILHLVFNALWLWEFGRRIEYAQGHWRLFWLVLVIGLGSNFTQYLFAGNVLFGGMSGVVYGLVGYCWGWSLRRPDQDFGIPKLLIYMMIGLMFLALTGIFSLFGFGAIANAAHFSGFALGMLLGLLLASSKARGNHGLSSTD